MTTLKKTAKFLLLPAVLLLPFGVTALRAALEPPAAATQANPPRVMPGTLDPERGKRPQPGEPAAVPAQLPQAERADGPTFTNTLQVVLVPTTVHDKAGHTVNGLRANDFRLYDNDRPQKIESDIAFLPLSMVVCIQRSANVEAVLPKIKRLGNVMNDLLIGQGGEAAIVSFDHRIEVLQDFTHDPDLINQAVAKLKPGGQNSRLIDAVQQGVHMLRYKKDRRKVVLLISEVVDRSSEAHIREVATDLQMFNVDVYTLNISRIITHLTEKPDLPRPDPFPPGARPHPANSGIDPTTTAQMGGTPGNGAEFMPMLIEMFKEAKSIFIRNPASAFTHLTGGREIGFMTQGDLERAVADIGTELRSQYILSYSPNNKLEGGFHTIRVEVARPNLKIRTRPGYWMAGVPGGN